MEFPGKIKLWDTNFHGTPAGTQISMEHLHGTQYLSSMEHKITPCGVEMCVLTLVSIRHHILF